MKIGGFIKIQEEDDKKIADLKIYQQFVQKLMYLLYKNRPNIVFIIV